MLTINNPEAFARHIERHVASGSSYMEAILEFCTKRNIEPESVAPFINDKMKMELQREGLALHLLNKSKLDDALPFASI